VPPPIEVVITRWAKDKNIRGASSFMAFKSAPDDYDILARPLADKVFFAGEATNRKYPGTVHGAYMSGVRAAEEAMAALVTAGVDVKPFPPPPPGMGGSPSNDTFANFSMTRPPTIRRNGGEAAGFSLLAVLLAMLSMLL
jgi:hypothetical protein